ncbi:hypothetical protein ACFV5G_35975 [Streptomyces sp. NPDC059766]|uniref:hypothetical protein n=1 Tax=Streptomyces sp. NPDC059766 TaxID=3346940 RepID=UPI0036679B25
MPSPRPPGTDAPATCEVPHFGPVRIRGARHRLHRLVRHRERAVALGIAVTAAALVAAGPQDTERARGRPDRAAPGEQTDGAPAERHRAVETVTAPVRIADAATVRLLRPGDRVDVIAAGPAATDGDARVVARGALVTRVPAPVDPAEDGALVVLSVERATAARLVGAATAERLAVTLC